MKGRYRIIFLFVLLTAVADSRQAAAQTADLRKLRDLVQQPPARNIPLDTNYFNTLLLVSRAYYGVNGDSALIYARKALDYAATTGFKRGQADSWRLIGNAYEMVGDYQQMMDSYHRSKQIAETMGYRSLVQKADLNIAMFYRQMGEYDEALRQIGRDSIIDEHVADSAELAYRLNYLADISLHRGRYDQALAYALRAEAVAKALDDSLSMASFNNDLGRIKAAQGYYDTAIKLHLNALDYFRRTDDKLEATGTLSDLAAVYFMKKDLAHALTYAEQSLAIARKMHRFKELREASRQISEILDAKGDYAGALKYFRQHKYYSDSLVNEQSQKQIISLETRYEYAKREDSLRDAAMEKDLDQRHQLHNNGLQRVIYILIIAFLSIVALVLWRRRMENRKINELLMAKNQEIELQKEAIEHQAVQLLLNNQQKDKLFSIIAHDLKGPLNSLKGLMDLMKSNKLPEAELKSMMAELSRNVGHSSELVGNLLFWASSQLNGVVINPVILPMRQLMDDILNLYSRQAQDKEINFVNGIDEDAKAWADKDMVQVILRNLLNNAIKFCRPGDTINVTSKPKEEFVEICVADTGIGIKQELLEKIRRKESVTTYGTAREKGTGLGMLLCREFAEANNGTFYLDSEEGKGSCFYFTIPVAANSSSIRL